MGTAYIRYFLATFFTERSGLSDADAIQAYLQALTASGRKEELHCDLIDAFDDEHTCWQGLFWNDAYKVKQFPDPAQARAYAREVLWEPLFWPEPSAVAPRCSTDVKHDLPP